jgi:hypothetical protein
MKTTKIFALSALFLFALATTHAQVTKPTGKKGLSTRDISAYRTKKDSTIKHFVSPKVDLRGAKPVRIETKMTNRDSVIMQAGYNSILKKDSVQIQNASSMHQRWNFKVNKFVEKTLVNN